MTEELPSDLRRLLAAAANGRGGAATYAGDPRTLAEAARELRFDVRSAFPRTFPAEPFAGLRPIFEEEVTEALWSQVVGELEHPEAIAPGAVGLLELPLSSLPPRALSILASRVPVLWSGRGRPPARPQELRHPQFWLGRDGSANGWPANDLERLRAAFLEWTEAHPAGWLVLDGLEYWTRENPPSAVHRLLGELAHRASSSGGRVLATFRPGSLEPGLLTALEELGPTWTEDSLPPELRSPLPRRSPPWPRGVLELLRRWRTLARRRPMLLLVEGAEALDPASQRGVAALERTAAEGRWGVVRCTPDLVRDDVADPSALPPEAQELLRWCAAAGREVPEEALAAMTEKEEPLVLRTLLALEGQGWLARGHGPGSWRFSTEARRAAFPAPASTEVRARSLRLAAWFSKLPGADRAYVTELYHRSLAPADGVAWTRKGLDAALEGRSAEGFALAFRTLLDLWAAEGAPADRRVREGLRLVERAYPRIGASPLLDGLLEGLGSLPASAPWLLQVRGWRALNLATVDPPACVERLRELRIAMSSSGPGGIERPLCQLADATLSLLQGDLPSALRSSESVLHHPATGEHLFLQEGGRRVRGWTCLAQGRTQEAREEAELVHLLGEQDPDPVTEARALALLAAVQEREGDLPGALASTQAALAGFAEGTDVASYLGALQNLSVLEEGRGDRATARGHRDEATFFARALGVRLPSWGPELTSAP